MVWIVMEVGGEFTSIVGVDGERKLPESKQSSYRITGILGGEFPNPSKRHQHHHDGWNFEHASNLPLLLLI